jgi:hypothetical protein
MTDAPEKIWAKTYILGSNYIVKPYVSKNIKRYFHVGTNVEIPLFELTEYTRTDATDARIEAKDARIDVIDWREMFLAVHDRMRKSGESKEMGARWFSEAAHAALNANEVKK